MSVSVVFDSQPRSLHFEFANGDEATPLPESTVCKALKAQLACCEECDELIEESVAMIFDTLEEAAHAEGQILALEEALEDERYTVQALVAEQNRSGMVNNVLNDEIRALKAQVAALMAQDQVSTLKPVTAGTRDILAHQKELERVFTSLFPPSHHQSEVDDPDAA